MCHKNLSSSNRLPIPHPKVDLKNINLAHDQEHARLVLLHVEQPTCFASHRFFQGTPSRRSELEQPPLGTPKSNKLHCVASHKPNELPIESSARGFFI
jgi:hypothetical protein